MKRPSAIILSLALVLCSCTVNIHDPLIGDKLVFSAVASHSSKGIIATTTYPLDEPFVVEAVHSGESFISGETVEYNMDFGYWMTSEEHLWPSNGTITFYAGSPIVPQLSISRERGVEADWSIPSNDETTVDLCFAEVSEPCKDHTAAVPLVFSHALSQVCFKARTFRHYSSSQTADNLVQANVITVVLDSMKLKGVVSEAHFTQSPFMWELKTGKTAEYTIFSDPEGLELKCDRYDNPILENLTTMLLIPQNLSSNVVLEEWHHSTVRTSITDIVTGKIVSDVVYSIPKTSSIQLAKYCKGWAPDYKFTFRVAMGMDDTEIKTAVTDWLETREIIPGDE